MEHVLWYKTMPTEWMEGLPIGNGRLAAMILNEETTDVVSLNHEWLWRGQNRHREPVPAASHLQEVRDCLRNGDFFQGSALANAYFGGHGGISGLPHRVDPYQPAGELRFALDGEARFQQRSLDIVAAVATAEHTTVDAVITSTFLAHPVHNLIVCRWSAAGGSFSGVLRYARVQDDDASARCDYNATSIEFSCTFEGGISFKTLVDVRTDGIVTAASDGITIQGATSVTAFVNIGTSVKGIAEELALYPVPVVEWDSLLDSHRAAFRGVLGRTNLDIALPENPAPTDARIENVRSGGQDATLPLLYFNYGKYLLASSSICGELPANLQGKWNDSIEPPWECDYHFDINLQMNYWMAEACNLPECSDALIQYVERFLPYGKKAAKELYGCRGVWLPITSDAWGRATPEAHGWAVWIGAAPWIAQHLWRHYEYNGDIGYLRDRAYPFFREIALFYEDYLVADETGVFQIMPSQSPENRFVGTGYWPVSIGVSSAMDVQLAYDALGYAIQAARLLGVDAAERETWEHLRSHLPPFRIGSDGRLLEWDSERPEVEPGHRHLSHLYGLHPSDLFNPIDRPEQYWAAIRSLEYRLEQGGGHTGWSRAWVACFFARIGRGDEVWEHLTALIADFATVSLLDLHPPRIFQIDGNLGAVEAVLQCFMQSWGGKIHLLRALPAAWPTGSLRGVKAPGGHLMDLQWRDGELTSVAVTIGFGGSITLGGLAGRLSVSSGARVEGEDIVISGKPGDTIVLTRAI